MKLKIFVALLLVAGAWVAGRMFVNGRAGVGSAAERHAVAGEAAPGGGNSGSVTEENGASVQRFKESYRLAQGARVEVSGINGPVEIATGAGETAEVNVESRAGDADALKRGSVRVEYANDRLVVRGPKSDGFLSWLTGRGRSRVRHNVRLTLPRSVALNAAGINGRVRVGEIDGALEVSGVNGGVEAASAAGGADFSGVNGGLSLSLASLAAGGVEVSGVNGRIELRLAPTVNADVEVSGINGRVTNELPNATVEDQGHSRFQARVGAGGPRIQMTGINGGVAILGR